MYKLRAAARQRAQEGMTARSPWRARRHACSTTSVHARARKHRVELRRSQGRVHLRGGMWEASDPGRADCEEKHVRDQNSSKSIEVNMSTRKGYEDAKNDYMSAADDYFELNLD